MEPIAVRVRVILGGILGFVAWAVQVTSAGISYAMHDSIRERATRGDIAATFAFSILFTLGGALVGRMTVLKAQWPKFLVGGAIGGGLVWSYLTATWTFTARASAIRMPGMNVSDAIGVGLVLGLAVGSLLYLISNIRRAIVARKGMSP